MDESKQVIESADALEPISDEMLRRYIRSGISASDWAKMNLEVDEYAKDPDSDPDGDDAAPKDAKKSKGGIKTSRKKSGTTGKAKKAYQGPVEAQTQDAPTARVRNALDLRNALIADIKLQVHDTRSRRAAQNAASSKYGSPPSTLRMMR